MRAVLGLAVFLAIAVDGAAAAATIDDVRFLERVEAYEAIVDTTLVTPEGKRVPIDRGTRLVVAGFTDREALVISRSDRPVGFVPKEDIAPAVRPLIGEAPAIRERPLP
jgi:hypothetical protein